MFPKPDPMDVFLEAVISGDPSGAILNQEKRGQEDLNAYDVLPRDLNGETRETFEAAGFVFGEAVDDQFVKGKLPAGWKKVAAEHSMWTDLVDDKGRKRGDIFYKAAFYDRHAHMNLKWRYGYNVEPVTGWGEGYREDAACVGVVKDCGTIIWKTDQTAGPNDYKAQGELKSLAKAWIEEHFPDYRSPLAYWE